MPEPMSDARLEHISGCLDAPCPRDLAVALARQLLAEVKRQRGEIGETRERIALILERRSNRHNQDAERHADERSPLLQAQAEALWDAARKIRSGKEGNDDGQ